MRTQTPSCAPLDLFLRRDSYVVEQSIEIISACLSCLGKLVNFVRAMFPVCFRTGTERRWYDLFHIRARRSEISHAGGKKVISNGLRKPVTNVCKN